MNDFSEQTIHNLARLPNAKIGFLIDNDAKFLQYKSCLNTLQLFEKNLHITDTDSFYEVMNLATNTIVSLCRSEAKNRISRSHLIFIDDDILADDWAWSRKADVLYHVI